MELLLDHMLGKKIQRSLKDLGYNTTRVYELGLHDYFNGELYIEANRRDMILVSCDSDFNKLSIGSLGNLSIIYLKPYPDTRLRYLIPLIESFIPELDQTKFSDHLIVINHDGIQYRKFSR